MSKTQRRLLVAIIKHGAMWCSGGTAGGTMAQLRALGFVRVAREHVGRRRRLWLYDATSRGRDAVGMGFDA